jgi:hypothetical protein
MARGLDSLGALLEIAEALILGHDTGRSVRKKEDSLAPVASRGMRLWRSPRGYPVCSVAFNGVVKVHL